jgi:hypothetical protein
MPFIVAAVMCLICWAAAAQSGFPVRRRSGNRMHQRCGGRLAPQLTLSVFHFD